MPELIKEDNSFSTENERDVAVSLSPEVKLKIDEVCRLVSNLQTELRSRGEEADRAGETVYHLATEASKLTEDVQGLVSKLKEEEKARQELEAKFSRLREVNVNGEGEVKLSDDEYVENVLSYLTSKGQWVNTSEFLEKSNKDLMSLTKFYLPHATQSAMDRIKALTSGSDRDVGALVPADMVRGITKRVWETTPVTQYARTIRTVNISVPWQVWDTKPTTAKRRELDDFQETQALSLVVKNISVHERVAEIPVTIQLLEDVSIDLVPLITDAVSEEFSRQRNTDFTLGTGNDEAEGFATLDIWSDPEIYERDKFGGVITETTKVFGYNDFANLLGLLLERYQADARFWMHRLSWTSVLKLIDNDGRPLINPQLFFQGPEPQIMGRPVVLASDLPKPNLVTGEYVVGQKPIYFGDMRQSYLIVERIGMRVVRDEITDPKFVKWRFRQRYGGGVVNWQSLKVMVIS